ncbi:MAG: hypothetical protein V4641_16400 [Pseudomonadota bacterium]
MTTPFTCTGQEPAGDAEIYDKDGAQVTVIVASTCFAKWYCENFGYTWKWRNGVDPDDPTTWPGYIPPKPPDPPAVEPE